MTVTRNYESSEFVLPLADPKAILESVGGKGASLARLVAAGLPVPDGFHVTTAAYRRFVADNDLAPGIMAALAPVDTGQPATLEAASAAIRALFAVAQTPPDVASAIAVAYGALAGREPVVAVRSSATAEDLPEASFAGQQDTYLNIHGTEEVLAAIKRCWASLWTARAIGYRIRQGIDHSAVSLAVVVQTLVPAEAAGILFTAHPLTGRRDQAMISAAWGLGEAVVGGLVTPDTLIVDKASGAVLDRQIADKQVMTVRLDGGTAEQPVPAELQRAPVLDAQVAGELARLGVQIEELYGMPMDVEWALADGALYIVQARPITALPEKVVPPPDHWELPEPKGRYMRTSVIDFMPDPLSPLFATMGVPAYNESLGRMLVDITGTKGRIFPDDIIVTIENYAYMRVNFSPGEWWAMLSKLGLKLPRLIRQGPRHFREEALPAYRERVAAIARKSPAELPAKALWQDVHELMRAAVYHLSVLQVDTLGAAAGSEGLFTLVYNRFFRRVGDPEASAFLMGYDSTPIRAEKSLYDLAAWAKEHPALYEYMLATQADDIASRLEDLDPPEGVSAQTWMAMSERVNAHLQTFGHLLYDFDFAKPVPAEDPALLFETAKMYLRGQGTNPHTRQQRLERARKEAVASLLDRARGLRGWAVRKSLHWAQSLAEVREDSIASIGLAYPRMRELLKELGQRMVEAGVMEAPTDIFWLEEAEITALLPALQAGEPLASRRDQIEERKAMRRAAQKVMPPTQLPYSKTYLGIPVEIFVPGEGGQEGGRLKGAGTSTGRVTGIACVLHGPEDFDQMQQGGILVAKLTTPAWTPLFAMAGGIVTDIGGPLSHGSIVAREYGIPAVLGTVAATRLIQSGQRITVDGDEGVVVLDATA